MNRAKPLRLVPLAFAVLLTAGCGSWKIPTNVPANLPTRGIIPDSNVNLGPSVSMKLEKLVYWGIYASVAYMILDPWAPNWEIEEAKFPGDHYKMSLHMKRYYAGGAGEARQVFHRRAKELMLANGFDGYRVIEYSESLESSVLGSQRAAEGVVLLTKAD